MPTRVPAQNLYKVKTAEVLAEMRGSPYVTLSNEKFQKCMGEALLLLVNF